MKKLTLRIDDYLYNELNNMRKLFSMSMNNLLIELVQIGILEKEKQILNGGKNDEK